MSKPDLSALQRRSYEFYYRFDPAAKLPQTLRIRDHIRLLKVHAYLLREAQFSPVESKGTQVVPLKPILANGLDALMLMADDLQINLGEAMSARSDAHQQPFYVATAADVRKMSAALDPVVTSYVPQPVRNVLHEPIAAMAWRIQSRFDRNEIDLETALESHWTWLYGLDQPSRAAYQKVPVKREPAVR